MSSIDQIKQLRTETGAGIVDVKAALEEAGGDQEQAKTILRKKGKQLAEKKANREVHEGFVGTYVHATGKIGAMVALACETDFVARTEDFKALANDIAMHVAALQPAYLAPEDVPAEEIEKEKDIYREQLAKAGKPENMLDKILAGKLEKFYEQTCLVRQPFVKDDSKTIEELVTAAVTAMGENIRITSFSYLAL
ncbi:MAG: translation elongation factor Ts [Patescibacteria group bacterium]|jgi:elongation factor Ts